MIISQTSTATGKLTSATVAAPRTRNRLGSAYPSPTPAVMQTATQSVRQRSNAPMAGAFGVSWSFAEIAISLMGNVSLSGRRSMGWLSWLRDAARQFQQTINADRLVPQQRNDGVARGVA